MAARRGGSSGSGGCTGGGAASAGSAAAAAPAPAAAASFDVPPELACPLCLDLFYEPVVTPCGHRYCRACISRARRSGHISCPLCRGSLEDFDAEAAPTDEATKALLDSAVPAEAVAQRLRVATCRLDIVVGNLYEEVRRERNKNKWTMYVSLQGAANAHVAALIDKVVYELHPTFTPSTVTCHGPDFSLCRYGWGIFSVGCVIHWNARLGLPPTEVDHMLVFEGNGGRTSAAVDVDPEILGPLLEEFRPSRPSERSLRQRAPASARGPLPRAAALQPQSGLVRLVVGNRCERREDNRFSWTMYVRLPDFGMDLTNRMIDNVSYELHPTFRPSNVTVNRDRPGFELNRRGWGTFPVTCTINWCRVLQLRPTQVTHNLDFNDGGAVTETAVEAEPARLATFRAAVS